MKTKQQGKMDKDQVNELLDRVVAAIGDMKGVDLCCCTGAGMRFLVLFQGVSQMWGVDATEKVICYGKRATIVGGRIRAGEIVNTKTLGSVSFTETIVEVGVDPKSRQRLFELDKEQNKNIEQLDKLNTNIGTLENQQKVKRNWTEEKKEMLDQMHVSRDELSARMNEVREEMDELKSYLKLLKSIGIFLVLIKVDFRMTNLH